MMKEHIEMIIDNAITDIKNVTADEFYNQVDSLTKTIIDEVNTFNPNKEYIDIYGRFRESVDNNYLPVFTDILEASVRIMIHEIYLSSENMNNIEMNYDLMRNASAKKRKHFDTAKEIAIKTLKMYSLNPSTSQKIIHFIDEYLPGSYVKNSDIDLVVWYFLVCIVTYNLFLKNKVT